MAVEDRDVFGMAGRDRLVVDVGGGETPEDSCRHGVLIQRRRAGVGVFCCAVGMGRARFQHCRIDERTNPSRLSAVI